MFAPTSTIMTSNQRLPIKHVCGDFIEALNESVYASAYSSGPSRLWRVLFTTGGYVQCADCVEFYVSGKAVAWTPVTHLLPGDKVKAYSCSNQLDSLVEFTVATVHSVGAQDSYSLHISRNAFFVNDILVRVP